MWRSERKDRTDCADSCSEETETTRRPDWRSRNPWEGAMATRVRRPRGRTKKRSTARNPEREPEDLTLMGTSIVFSRNSATGPDSNPPPGPGEQEKPTLWRRQCRSDCHHHERSERDTSVPVRGNDHWTPTHQTTSPLGRDDWKARTRTEGDSKAPSAIIASSTCCKAGARGKHTWNVLNETGERKRGREESRKEQGNRPKERTCLQDSASIARQCGGRAAPQAERGTTRREVPFQLLFQ